MFRSAPVVALACHGSRLNNVTTMPHSAMPTDADEPGQVAAPPEPAIAIIAADPDDRALQTRLITDLGFTCRSYEEAWQFDQAEDTARALVVCFRVAQATTHVPVFPVSARGCRILVLSDLEDERHVVDTLGAGAHHLFRIDELPGILQARLGAALRRHDRVRNGSMEVAPFCFELAHRRVSLEDRVLDLSPKEFDLAFYLFANRGRVVTNAELLTSVWSLPQDIDTRRIDTAACRVRKKMQLGDQTGWVLRRFRREGYGLYSDTRDVDTAVPAQEERRELEE